MDAFLDWYANQLPQTQAAVQGGAVMLLFALIKALAFHAGHPLSQSALGKIGKLLAVAVATAGTPLVSQHGFTHQFWLEWFAAFCAAVGGWEALSKLWAAGGSVTVPQEDLQPVPEARVDALNEAIKDGV